MDQNSLMQVVQMYDFYLEDLQLYLDTHPMSTNALEMFNKYQELRKAAYEAYAIKFGPIILSQTDTSNHFNWVDGPWPWERSTN